MTETLPAHQAESRYRDPAGVCRSPSDLTFAVIDALGGGISWPELRATR